MALQGIQSIWEAAEVSPPRHPVQYSPLAWRLRAFLEACQLPGIPERRWVCILLLLSAQVFVVILTLSMVLKEGSAKGLLSKTPSLPLFSFFCTSSPPDLLPQLRDPFLPRESRNSLTGMLYGIILASQIQDSSFFNSNLRFWDFILDQLHMWFFYSKGDCLHIFSFIMFSLFKKNHLWNYG